MIEKPPEYPIKEFPALFSSIHIYSLMEADFEQDGGAPSATKQITADGAPTVANLVVPIS